MSWLSQGLKALGGAVKPIARGALQLAGGPITSALVGTAAGMLTRGGGGTPRLGAGPQIPQIFTGARPGLDFGDVGDFIRRVAPGGATGRGRVAMDSGGHCPRGYHPAKDGRGCVRNRKMNFTNSRATGRAVRRIAGAEKQYKKIFRIMNPGKKGRPVIRKRGR